MLKDKLVKTLKERLPDIPIETVNGLADQLVNDMIVYQTPMLAESIARVLVVKHDPEAS